MIRVAVEGNIGCGKTSVVKWAASIGLATPIYEPVPRWQTCGGANLLQNFYKDPKQGAFPMQMYAQLTMFQTAGAEPRVIAPKEVLLHERTPMASRFVFTEALRRSGYLTSPELTIIDEAYRFYEFMTKPKFDVIVYLKCPTSVCWERVKDRARPEENNLNSWYLETLNQLYEEWLVEKRAPSHAGAVVVIDGTLPEPEIQHQIRTVVEYARKHPI